MRRHDELAMAAMNDALLQRVRTEREQSLGSRVREMFTDMRFFWPALGATMAVAICATVAAGVLQASTAERPNSLAALIGGLAPGTVGNPMRPANNGVSSPRLYADDAKRAGGTLDRLPEDDVIYTIRTVVTRDGRVSNFEVLLSDGEPVRGRSAEDDNHARAVLDAVQQSRFAPAYTPLGQAVAVDVVWVIAKTTAVAAAEAPEHFAPLTAPARRKPAAPVQKVAEPVEPEAIVEPVPGGEQRQSGAKGDLTTA
jgi:hypothetical protein